MKYLDFLKHVTFGNFTAFVFDEPSNRYNYSSGTIDENVFYNAPEDGYEIVKLKELPLVQEAIVDNFLFETAPASGVEDEYYEALKHELETGESLIGYWREGDSCTYMLLDA